MEKLLMFLGVIVFAFAQDNTDLTRASLDAFGVATNSNIPSLPENRLNPLQNPQTNNLRVYQSKAWTTSGTAPTLTYGAGITDRAGCRIGPYLGTIGLTGPGIIYPKDNTVDFVGNNTGGTEALTLAAYGTDAVAETNMCATQDGAGNFSGYNRPTITENSASVSLIYNAAEFSADPAEGFNEDEIKTIVDPYGMSLQVIYKQDDRSIIDYVVMGNSFHDVFYKKFTPRFLCDTIVDPAVDAFVDGVNVGPLGDGATIGPGTSFRIPIATGTASPVSLVIYLESESGQTLTFTNNQFAGADPRIILTADSEFTGWVRTAFIRPGAPDDIVGGSIPGGFAIGGQSTSVPVLTTPATTNAMLTPDWANQVEVQAIANSPINYWVLYPHAWIGRVNAQMLFHSTDNSSGTDIEWPGNANGLYRISPNAKTTCFLLPLLTFDNGTDVVTTGPETLFDYATQIFAGEPLGTANGLTTNFAGYGGSFPTPSGPYGSESMSLFTLSFLMGYTHGQASASTSFQDALTFPSGNDFPVHAGTNGTTAAMNTILDGYRSAIPTRVKKVTFNPSSNSITLDYAMASNTSGTSQTATPLIAFPAWMETEGGVTEEDFVFITSTKGSLFTAGATNGQLTFGERDWSGAPGNWIENGDFLPPFASLSALFGADGDATTTLGRLSDVYTDEVFSWITATTAAWPTQVAPVGPPPGDQAAMAQPLFMSAEALLGGYGSGLIYFQIANTALWMAEYVKDSVSSDPNVIRAASQPLIDYLKRRLFDTLIHRPLTQNFLSPDTTNHGVCFYGEPIYQATGTPSVAESKVGIEQQTGGIGVDFGNPEYNDHVLQYGYYLQALARVIAWDNEYTTTKSDRFINQKIVGADHNTYTVRQMADMIWRDVCNPFIETKGFPFLRYFNLWEGHHEAQGMTYPDSSDPTNVNFPKGRNAESLAEGFASISGAFYYAVQVLNEGGLTSDQQKLYEDLRDRMLLLMKFLTSSSRVLWQFEGAGYKTSGGGVEEPTFFNGYFANYCLTAGNINDVGIDSSVAFLQGPAAPPLATCP